MAMTSERGMKALLQSLPARDTLLAAHPCQILKNFLTRCGCQPLIKCLISPLRDILVAYLIMLLFARNYGTGILDNSVLIPDGK